MSLPVFKSNLFSIEFNFFPNFYKWICFIFLVFNFGFNCFASTASNKSEVTKSSNSQPKSFRQKRIINSEVNNKVKKIRSVSFQRGQVINQDAAVYAKPDFDSEVLYILEKGDRFDISIKTNGPFYRVILDRKNKIYGWVADNEIVPITKIKKNNKTETEIVNSLNSQNEDLEDEEEEEFKKVKKIEKLLDQRWIGPQTSFVNYTEDTMGRLRSEIIPFYGLKIYGPDSLFSGPIVTESNILISKSPNYYKKVTRNKADGYVLIADFNFQQQLPMSEKQIWSYGFGPLIKYSDLKLYVGDTSYFAQDLILGANLNVGTLYSFGPVALRSDFKFVVEKKTYFSLSLGLLFPF